MIFAGCPIQNREEFVDGYIKAFENQTYPISDIHLCFLVNDSTDGTLEKLQEHKKDHNFGKFTVIDLIGMEYQDIPQSRPKRAYEVLANLRNIWVGFRGYESHVFSVDSDIIIPPDALQRLLFHKLDICSLLIHNSEKIAEAYNFGSFNSKKTALHRIRSPGVNPVDMTGAAYLINAKVFDSGVKYGYNRRGEDIYFCEMAKKHGFGIYCDMDLEAEHLKEGVNG